jgi:bacterioferritin
MTDAAEQPLRPHDVGEGGLMNVQDVIAGLNRILALEYAAVVQYLQHSYLVQGLEREYLADFFRDMAKKGVKTHVPLLGDKIVALGGIPTVEPGAIKQSLDTAEMLEQDLELERAAQQAQKDLLQQVQDDVPLRFMLEDMIYDEQEQIEELEKILRQKQLAIAAKELHLKQVS